MDGSPPAELAADDTARHGPQRVVLLFGPQAQAAGARELWVCLPAGATAAALKNALGRCCPALGPSLPVSRVAVDHRFVPDEATLPADAELALVGLVGGG